MVHPCNGMFVILEKMWKLCSTDMRHTVEWKKQSTDQCGKFCNVQCKYWVCVYVCVCSHRPSKAPKTSGSCSDLWVRELEHEGHGGERSTSHCKPFYTFWILNSEHILYIQIKFKNQREKCIEAMGELNWDHVPERWHTVGAKAGWGGCPTGGCAEMGNWLQTGDWPNK